MTKDPQTTNKWQKRGWPMSLLLATAPWVGVLFFSHDIDDLYARIELLEEQCKKQ
jgi:hypothetical protein